MPRTLVIHAHPSPRQSLVVRSLLLQLKGVPHTTVRSLYNLYPDFDIDVAAEQAALAEAERVVWLAPVYWYSVPALLKHWFDQVLVHGWAYGAGGEALRGKTAWWVVSAGGSRADYTPDGVHQRPFADFIAPIEQTARFCGMHWLAPHVEHGGHEGTSSDPARLALAERLAALRQMAPAQAAQPESAT